VSHRPTSTRATPRQATSAVAHIAPEPDAGDPLLSFEPFVHKAPRGNSITPDLQRRFVATLAATGIVKVAARRIGKSLEALYKLRHKPGAEGFAAAWDAALDRGVQRLEEIAMERAMIGMPTPIVSGGKLLGTWDKPDNALLRFLLAHRLPRKYGPKAVPPTDAVRERYKEEALEVARSMLREERMIDSDALTALLDHMHANHKKGIPQITGIDTTLSIREAAEKLLADREQDGAAR